MNELDKVLDQDEDVVWSGKPNFLPYVVAGSLPAILMGLGWLLFLFLLIIDSSKSTQGVTFMQEVDSFFPYILVGLLIIISGPIIKILQYEKTYYAITNKRVLFQLGIVGRDFKGIDYDKVTKMSVDVGLIDKIFGHTGSIILGTASVYNVSRGRVAAVSYRLNNLEKPYEVFKKLKKVSYDIKTDINYPNEMRPSGNPGYDTKYDPDNKQ